MSNPPRTLRTTRIPISSTPAAKISVGMVATELSIPSPTGTVVFAASGTRRTKPASTKPMNAMKHPIPAAIAAFSSSGIAWKTAVRNPEMPSATMIRPSTITNPIASGHVIWGANDTASRLLMPSPAASANG
ncbi:Uncharacterised protein [Mycobacteroides abscessus subsp. abscessus]|nr:Uncharacterised protein [Mycobacteroides abscessus subsp. abscessus]SIF54735.1 Uncharacterised protein [Mycobacteroides abscessus subsp. abscessus]SIL72915.1 Uncharacterised protein [Mycobacteroides abscessus subsp. abscessus]SIN40723.1 Uncharacterised protein [Mycobacteroides abscessus subsp. abscessus]SKH46606.1 Uncharacterised protein [Mycobacteroides abscessus subsp. abscessus]